MFTEAKIRGTPNDVTLRILSHTIKKLKIATFSFLYRVYNKYSHGRLLISKMLISSIFVMAPLNGKRTPHLNFSVLTLCNNAFVFSEFILF